MIQIIKLSRRHHSKVYDIVCANPHMENVKQSIRLGSLDKINHTYKIDLELLESKLGNGCKISRKLYYILRKYNIKLDSKHIK